MEAYLRLWISDFQIHFPDGDPYYHGRIAREILETHRIPVWDGREMGGIPYYYPPLYSLSLALWKALLLPQADLLWIGGIINVVSGTFTALPLYLLSRRVLKGSMALLPPLLFSLTPAVLYRTSLWARPIGLTLFFTYLLLHLLTPSRIGRDRWALLAPLVLSFALAFTHSSWFWAVPIFTLASLASSRERRVVILLIPLLLPFLALSLRSLGFLPFLDLSWGVTVEYQPLITGERFLSLMGPSLGPEGLLRIFLLGAVFGLAGLPLMVHGLYLFTKRKERYLLFLSCLFLLSAFVAINVYLLFFPLLCVPLAVSLDRLREFRWEWRERSLRWGPLVAVLLLLSLLSLGLLQIGEVRGIHAGTKFTIVGEVLSETPLEEGVAVLSNDINVGHAIPYHSAADAFLSDLSDTQMWVKRYGIYRHLLSSEASDPWVWEVMEEEGVSYLLLIEGEDVPLFPFLEPDPRDRLTLLSEREGEGVSVRLYRVERNERGGGEAILTNSQRPG
jgi:hypothetical protein